MTPFRTRVDAAFTIDEKNTPPALLINPAADARSLLGAAQARMEGLHQILWQLCQVGVEDGAEIRAVDIAGALEPITEEVKLLLEAMNDRLRNPTNRKME